MTVARGGARPSPNLKRIRIYIHETLTGPGTILMSVQSQLCGSVTFGQVGVLDTEVRDGPDQRRSSPLGWFQGAMTGTPACCRR